MWHWGAGSVNGRYFRWSSDSGASWTEPALVHPNLKSGLAGWSYLILDGAGTLHLIGSDGSIYHAIWDQRQWSAPTWLTDGEFPDVIISNGNWIHVVFSHYSGDGMAGGEIAYMRMETEASHIPPMPDTTTSTLTAAPVAPDVNTATSTPSPIPNTERTLPRHEIAPLSAGALSQPVLLGSVMAFFVATLTLLLRRRDGRHH